MKRASTLGALLAGLTPVPAALAAIPITGLCEDSRQVQPGDLFLARCGLQRHGLDFLPAVRAARAAAIAWEPPYPDVPVAADLPLLAVPALSQRLGLIAARFYGEPAKDLQLIGVTGTDGKTSCVQLIAQALYQQAPCGVFGTLGHGLYGQTRPARHTTPDSITVQRLLAELRTAGTRTAVMEVSSHALDQGRVAELRFAVAVLTNLGRDHLDYHGDLETYAAAKARLFRDYRSGAAVLNLDDPFGRRLAAELKDTVIGYGLGARPAAELQGWVWGEQLTSDVAGLQLHIDSSWGRGKLHSRLLGRFNAYNLLAALAALLASGMPLPEALAALERAGPIPGRMEPCGGGKRPLAVIDYAHTPQALEQALLALRAHSRGRLWCLFGCGGERDPGKRPLMGAIAERLADRVIVTDDNPRGEDPAAIVAQILAGFARPERASVQPDRAAAIRQTLGAAAAGDIVLIAGKGHEDYQQIGAERRPFDDRALARQCLQEKSA